MEKPNRWFVYSTLQLYKCCNSEDVSETIGLLAEANVSSHTKSGTTATKQFVIAVECLKNVNVVMACGKEDWWMEKMSMLDAQVKCRIDIQRCS